MMITLTATAVVPAAHEFTEVYGVNADRTPFFTSSQILTMGIFPQLWSPVASRYGRLPVFLASTFGAMVCNIGGCFAKTYEQQLATRILNTVFICPPIAMGAGVVTDIFFRHERATRIGFWNLLTTLGAPFGPFLFGFIVKRAPWQWIFGIFAIINFLQFIGYLFFSSETLGWRDNHPPASSDSSTTLNSNSPPDSTFASPTPTLREEQPAPSQMSWGWPYILANFHINRLDPSPFTVRSFLNYLNLGLIPAIVIPTVAHALVFGYTNVAMIVMMPHAIGDKFDLDAQGVGLQYIAIIVGSLFGESIAGPISDRFLALYRDKTGSSVPSRRLWLSYPAVACVFTGLLTWGFQLQNAEEGVYDITPAVGAGIAAFGSQILSTTLITFAVDNNPARSSEVGLFVNCIRQCWAFLGPFYLPPLFDAIGYGPTAGFQCGLIGVMGIVPLAILHFAYRHRTTGEPSDEGEE